MLVDLNGSVVGLRVQGRGQEEAWHRSTKIVRAARSSGLPEAGAAAESRAEPACSKAVPCAYHFLGDGE